MSKRIRISVTLYGSVSRREAGNVRNGCDIWKELNIILRESI